MKDKIWISSPHMGGNEQDYINEAFDENWIAPLGPNVNGFEAVLSNYINTINRRNCGSLGQLSVL